MEGIAVFAADGDGGAAFCDAGASVATDGIGVNAYASTSYNVAVGGTDFADSYFHDVAIYWNKTNTATGESARSYVPEVPWNDSCGNPLIASNYGFSITYGASGFCYWDFKTFDAYQTTTAAGGGPSGCALGSPAIPFQVSGGCIGRAKPSWQKTVPGYSDDGVRDLPDVVLFAGDGIWGHYYIYCDSNVEDSDGAPCHSNEVSQWSQAGGTSFAAPIMAGIHALVVQKWGREGNPNPVYYKIASAQFGSKTLASGCNASNGVSSSSNCVFHDVTLGASAVNCEGLVNCYRDVLSTRSSAFDEAYGAHSGWDFASGLGSVNAYNLVMSTEW
jgi:subtilase family serine protease